MTKQEKIKCEYLVNNAIYKATNAKISYTEYERLLKEGKQIEAECKLRLSDQLLGFSDGVYHALCLLGFDHEKMKELAELL